MKGKSRSSLTTATDAQSIHLAVNTRTALWEGKGKIVPNRMCNLVQVCIKTRDCSDMILVIAKLHWALCKFHMIEGRNARDQIVSFDSRMLAAYVPHMPNSDLKIGISGRPQLENSPVSTPP